MKLKELFESTGKSVADLGIEDSGTLFNCWGKGLTSLDGSPSHIHGSFWCINNKLTSLEGGPTQVDGDFNCCDNNLGSLKGAPRRVGVPGKLGGMFICRGCKLTSLEGAPEYVNAAFDCSENKLVSLKNVHKFIKELRSQFDATKNPIKSHVLGLLLIKGITNIRLDNKQVERILNKYLGKVGSDRSMLLQAQEELMEAGLEEFAQL